MDSLVLVFIFLFGLAWGSFMNVIVYRLNTDQSPWKGRSFCPKCKAQINWYDNIPLISFLMLRGRCRHCHSPISWQYPLMELLTGFSWVAVALWFGLNSVIWLVFWLLVSWLLAGIFLSDLTYQTIPDELSLGLMGFGLVRVFWQRDWSGLLAGLGVGLFFWLLHVGTKKKGMGLGDVRLVPGLGFLLGATKTLVGMYVSFLTGAIFGLGLIIFGQKRFGQKIAFGPFLILGTVAAFFWSETLIDWWFGLFGW